MKDYLLRGITSDGKYKIAIAMTTDLVNEVRTIQNTSIVSTNLLGRFLTSAALLGSNLKEHEQITMQMKCNGPCDGIIADSNSYGEVRGYIKNPTVILELQDDVNTDYSSAIGKGYLNVTKWLKDQKDPYQGLVNISEGSVAKTIVNYLYGSEQNPSVLSLGIYTNADCNVSYSGGILIQKLPGTKESEIFDVEEKLNKFYPLSQFIIEGFTLERIVNDIFEPIKVEYFPKSELFFKCGCSMDKIKNMMISLGKPVIKDILEKEKSAEIFCEFCKKHYYVNSDELIEIYQKASDGKLDEEQQMNLGLE